MTETLLRLETPADYRSVEELTRDAFWNVHMPGCTEHYVLHCLRNTEAFIPYLDFVAEIDGKIVGHIAYTYAAIIDDENGTQTRLPMFGPVSVLPSFQKQGIGSALIRHTMNLARQKGEKGVCIYGDPRYYHRFGFHCSERYDFKTEDDKYAVALLAAELFPGAFKNIRGRVIEDQAFSAGNNETAFRAFDATFPVKEKGFLPSQTDFGVLVTLRY